jgi:hypothetical protein
MVTVALTNGSRLAMPRCQPMAAAPSWRCAKTPMQISTEALDAKLTVDACYATIQGEICVARFVAMPFMCMDPSPRYPSSTNSNTQTDNMVLGVGRLIFQISKRVPRSRLLVLKLSIMD